MNRSGSSTEIAKQIKNDYKKIMASKEEYIEELEEACRHYKNKASNMERGPKVEGNLDDIKEIAPDLLKEFVPYAPKWLKPLLGNEAIQGSILEYVTKNPEKAGQLFSKFVKNKKGGKSGDDEKVEPDAEISV